VNRLHSLRRADFQHVWDKGKSWSHPLMVLRACANESSECRLGFVAGKKVGNAVRRNRIKRLMRESVHHRMTELQPGWDIILISRTNADNATFQEVDTAIEQLLRRANLIR
jgi:ribonuclease P protein component